jgi:hypothetical protein
MRAPPPPECWFAAQTIRAPESFTAAAARCERDVALESIFVDARGLRPDPAASLPSGEGVRCLEGNLRAPNPARGVA